MPQSVPVAELKSVVRGERQTFQLIFRATVPGADSDLWWGDPTKGYGVMSINHVRLVVIGPDNKEQHFYFEIIKGLGNQPLTILLEKEVDWIHQWKTKDG